MKKLIWTLALMLCFGCASLQHKTPAERAQIVLTDAEWGISAACSQEWLTPDVCTFGLDALRGARAAVSKDPMLAVAVATQTINDLEAKLSATSRLRIYLEAAKLALAAL